jgi:hypothetical protein
MTRHLPIDEQVEAARRRVGMIPEALRVSRVPSYLWPPGQRWCASCQSFVDLADVQGSRCRACNSAAAHSARIEKVYGLDRDGYDELLRLQGGKCAICRARPTSKRLAVDHDHKTGAVRGLLCSRCNHDLMGAAWDSHAMAKALLGYIEAPPATGQWVPPEQLGQREAVPAPHGLMMPGTGQRTPAPILGAQTADFAPGLHADDLYRVGAIGIPGGDKMLVYVKRGAAAPF